MLKALFIIFLIIFCSQYCATKQIRDVSKLKASPSNDSRGIKDVWTNIKATAKKAWNGIKTIAKNTKEIVKTWTENVKERAEQIRNNFEERLQKLKEHSKKIIEQAIGTGHLIKECMKEDKDAIKIILKDITKRVAKCMFDTTAPLSQLEENHEQIKLNDTELMSEVERKHDICVKSSENVEDCLHEIRNYIYKEMDVKENYILNERMESRSIVDNLLDVLVMCSITGMSEASSAIAAETVDIITCVKDQQSFTAMIRRF